MKVVSWNILQGGGKRLDGICDAIKGWAPDVLTLQEVRQSSLAHLSKTCNGLGLRHHYLAQTQSASENTLFIAAQGDLDAGDFMPNRPGLCHILEAEVAGLTLLPLHFPQKAAQVPLFEALLTDSASLLDLQSLMIGDLNCGLPFEDSSEKTFVNAKYFQALKDAGWIDLYRHLNGSEARDFTWISPRTGRGFRYDHALASPHLAGRAKSLHYDHWVREEKLSDHSALILTLS